MKLLSEEQDAISADLYIDCIDNNVERLQVRGKIQCTTVEIKESGSE
jgi:hypothetical protein